MATVYSKPYPSAILGAGPIPTNWIYQTSYISNATFTAPDRGWYKLFIWGGSGNGIAGEIYRPR